MDISEKTKSRWYVLQVMSGQEKRAEAALQLKREEAAREGIDNGIDDVRIPVDMVEATRSNKKGNEKKVVKEPRKRYPGYMLVQVRLYMEDGNINPAVWDLIKGTQGIIGFVGGEHPVMLNEVETAEMLRGDDEESTVKKTKVLFTVGENVVIKSGAFMGMNGIVDAIDNEHARLKVSVDFLGRTTSIELENSEVEKLQ